MLAGDRKDAASHDPTRCCHFTAQHMWKINLGLSQVVKRILFLCVCVSVDFHGENLSTFQHAALPCLPPSLSAVPRVCCWCVFVPRAHSLSASFSSPPTIHHTRTETQTPVRMHFFLFPFNFRSHTHRHTD